MTTGDAYIAISYSSMKSEDFKDAWTGSLPSPTYLTIFESNIESLSSTFGRINEFVSTEAQIDSTDFFIPRLTEFNEDSDTILGVAETFYDAE